MSRVTRKGKKGLRTGYTTGACAAAASKAALLTLISRSEVKEVEIFLPAGNGVRFPVQSSVYSKKSATCSVIKDAGDDPDVTHGVEIFAEVTKTNKSNISILGGRGVGTVTKPGLGLKTGGPAINPVPRKMIRDALQSVNPETKGYQVTIFVPGGEELAKKTLNSRLGIIGGISILGTRGTVIPYSTNAYKQSVTQSISVAAASGQKTIVLTTGGRTEKAAKKIYGFDEEAFIQMGDFVGHALKEVSRAGIKKVNLVAMAGKMSKIASGHLQTHARVSQLKMEFAAQLALKAGLPEKVALKIKEANTARHVFEIIPEKYLNAFSGGLCQAAALACVKTVQGKPGVTCVLVNYDGTVLGRSQ